MRSTRGCYEGIDIPEPQTFNDDYRNRAAAAAEAKMRIDQDLNDRDSFHWHAEMLCRLIELFAGNGSAVPWRMSAGAEASMMDVLWRYAHRQSRIAEAETAKSRTWHIRGKVYHGRQLWASV